jgi:hypothetical protein
MEFVRMFVPLFAALIVLMVLAKLSVSSADEDRGVTEVGGRLEFAPNRRNFWGIYLFLAFLAYAIVGSLLSGVRSGIDLLGPLFFAGFIALLMAAFPGTIVADQDGIEQKYWLRGAKRIAWKDVSKVTVDEKRGEVKIKSKLGVKIVHSRQLPDRARLLNELQERCTETLVPAVAAASASRKSLVMTGPAA